MLGSTRRPRCCRSDFESQSRCAERPLCRCLRGTRDSSDGARTPHRTDIPSPKSAGRPARPAWSSRRSSSYSPVAAPPAPSALSAAPTTTRATPWRRAPFATAVTGWATAALSADGPPPQLPALRPALLLAPERRLRSSEARARDAPFHRQASLSSSSPPFRCTPPASPLCWWRAARCRCFRGGARAAAAPCPRRSSSSSHGGAPPPPSAPSRAPPLATP